MYGNSLRLIAITLTIFLWLLTTDFEIPCIKLLENSNLKAGTLSPAASPSSNPPSTTKSNPHGTHKTTRAQLQGTGERQPRERERTENKEQRSEIGERRQNKLENKRAVGRESKSDFYVYLHYSMKVKYSKKFQLQQLCCRGFFCAVEMLK